MSASGKPQWTTLFEPKVRGFPKAPFGDLDAVAALIGDTPPRSCSSRSRARQA